MSTPIPSSPAPAGPNPKGGTLVKAAWSALRADKELLSLPIVGGVASLLGLLPLLVITIVMNAGSANDNSNPSGIIVVVAAVSAFLVAIITTFFAVALAAGAHERMNGGNPTMKSAMAVAWKRKKGVIGWALLATTVGLVLQAIKDKVKGGGAIIAMLGDLAWAVASFFAIPIIAANDVGPIEALKLSTSTMKKRWSSAARVQLHRVSPRTWPDDFPLPCTFAMGVTPEGGIVGEEPASNHLLLLDTSAGRLAGGTGQVWPWEVARGIVARRPVMLAGGLHADNVAEAVTMLHPFGVDASSALESRPGFKDPDKVRRFIAAVRACDRDSQERA